MDRLSAQPANFKKSLAASKVFALFGNQILAYRRHFCAQHAVDDLTSEVGRTDFWSMECAKYYDATKTKIEQLLLTNKKVLHNCLVRECQNVEGGRRMKKRVGWMSGFNNVMTLELAFLGNLNFTTLEHNHRPEHDYKFDDFHHFVGHLVINKCMVTAKMKVMALLCTGQGLRNIQIGCPRQGFALVLAVVKRHGMALKDVPKKYWKDETVMRVALSNNGMALKHVYHAQKNNPVVVKTAVKNNGLALQYAYPKARNNIEIVTTAVQQNGLALQYASKTAKNNKSIVVQAILQNKNALKYASKRCQMDLELKRLATQCGVNSIARDNSAFMDCKGKYDQLVKVLNEMPCRCASGGHCKKQFARCASTTPKRRNNFSTQGKRKLEQEEEAARVTRQRLIE